MADPVLWFEVVGKNGGQLRDFYSKLFGWEISPATGDADYGLVTAANGGIAGGVGASQDGGDGHVTVFVEVDDPNAFLEQIEKLGGKTIVPPTEIPEYSLTFAYFTDPQGHLVGLSNGMNQQS
jgi:predicted enzyme related to lactoylglutathione lyase